MASPSQPPLFVLGTSSKTRHKLFKDNFDAPFTTLRPCIDEQGVNVGSSPRSSSDPKQLALEIAGRKADALVPMLQENSILITSDQVMLHAGKIREKPKDIEQCRHYLRSYSKHHAMTVTAVVVHRKSDDIRISGVDTCTQYFRSIPDDIVEQLLEKGEVLHCAGGITVEDELLKPYLALRQGDLDSFMGLPVRLLRRLIMELGVNI
ncbi:Maf-like protein [Gracilariopsis chorda]|uniref:Maf-like protein n=1 Tax=Gracilariopsis chorda TaxID=448386 RepID=A0A2V3ITG7_9FLOR|nr:Maf-like protein [Gracilariopsis chorda]|eukprot:PXF45404.1 Maf-like protein [Gracilariopsis chorda]